jgi:ASC-1-like (ASCH) protein
MTLFVKSDAYNELINNRKTIEGRVNLGFNKKIKENIIYKLKNDDREKFIKVIKVEKYDSLFSMISNVDVKKLLPYKYIGSKDDAIKHYQKIYPKIWERSFLAIYIKVI